MDYLVEVKCMLEKTLSAENIELKLGRYRLKAASRDSTKNQEAILVFTDEVIDSHSNPKEEGNIVISLMSLLLNMVIKKTGISIGGVNIDGANTPFSDPFELADEPKNEKCEMLYFRLLCMDEDQILNFLRACHAYSLALMSYNIDYSISFLLLVVSIESLSSQEEFVPHKELHKTKKSTERYVRFINTYCMDKELLLPDGKEEKFIKSLKTIYYTHRSGFVHSGREVSIAAAVADDLDAPYITHINITNGDKIETPGLRWFLKVVRSALLGFIEKGPVCTDTPNTSIFKNIAKDRGGIHIEVVSGEGSSRKALKYIP